jgi:hypothetical protein
VPELFGNDKIEISISKQFYLEIEKTLSSDPISISSLQN